MDRIVIMNTKTRQNATKALTNEFVADDYYTGLLVFRGAAGNHFGVPSDDLDRSVEVYNGKLLEVTIDTGLGYRRGGEARLVGAVSKDKNLPVWGTVPTQAVPVYVFK